MKKLLFAAITTTLVLPFSLFAQTAIPTAVQTNLDTLSSINQQITALQQQRATVLSEITLSLKQGSRGDQVKIIQAMLAADPSIYPEGIISGYFGALTAKAVRRFQEKNGLEQVGYIGPRTREKLNEGLRDTPIVFGTASSTGTSTVFTVNDKENEGDLKKSNNGEKHPCVMIPPGHLIAPGWLKKNSGDDHPILPPCQILPPGIQNILERVASSTFRGDHEDNQGDKVAPVISSIATSVSATSAVITWTTSEDSDAVVAYGATTAYGAVTHNGFEDKTHSITLTGLLSSTLYNYQVRSMDKAGNVAVSANLTFTTSAAADVAAPILSNVVSTVATTTAAIMWTSNELASSKVYFSTVTPVVPTTASVVSNPEMVLAHSLPLTGLTASTTYNFLVSSIDAAGNSATSSEQSFTTTQ